METVAGRYRVERELGAGGMGIVYLARDLKLDRLVALKRLRLSSMSTDADEAVHRFMREARVMGSLLHPSVVVLYDIVEEDDDLYLVMEYFPSRNLGEVVATDGRLEEDRVREIGRTLASALAAAHSEGIVHRDVKPENVLVGSSGVKLTDFGVARITRHARMESTRLTRSGVFVGTPGYLAPEVIRGEEATERSDVFSLGLVLYFALAGAPPFDAPDVASLL